MLLFARMLSEVRVLDTFEVYDWQLNLLLEHYAKVNRKILNFALAFEIAACQYIGVLNIIGGVACSSRQGSVHSIISTTLNLNGD